MYSVIISPFIRYNFINFIKSFIQSMDLSKTFNTLNKRNILYCLLTLIYKKLIQYRAKFLQKYSFDYSFFLKFTKIQLLS